MEMLRFQSQHVQQKIGTPVFSQSKIFVFLKTCFKIKVLKTFKIFSHYHIKTFRSLKQRAFLKIPSTIFKRTYARSFSLKIKPTKSFFLKKDNSNFVVKLSKMSNRSFSVYLIITFFKHLYFLICGNRNIQNPANIFFFKDNNRNTRKRSEICSQLTIKRQNNVNDFIFDFEQVFIFDFEQVGVS